MKHARIKQLVVAAVAASVIGVSGCGAPGSAATIDGETLSADDAQKQAQHAGEVLGGQVSPTAVVATEVNATVAATVAEETGVRVDQNQASSLLLQQGLTQEQLADPVVGRLLSNTVFAQLVQAQVPPQDYAAIAQTLDIEVNPRYGQLDPATGVFAAGGSLSLLSPQTMVKLQQFQTEQQQRQQQMG